MCTRCWVTGGVWLSDSITSKKARKLKISQPANVAQTIQRYHPEHHAVLGGVWLQPQAAGLRQLLPRVDGTGVSPVPGPFANCWCQLTSPFRWQFLSCTDFSFVAFLRKAAPSGKPWVICHGIRGKSHQIISLLSSEA